MATGPTPKCHFVSRLPSGSPEILKIRTLASLEAYKFVWKPSIELQLKWVLKQIRSFCQELSNSMLHATCTQGNQNNSQLLMVKNQIDNLTPGPFFGHNLCFNTRMSHANPF